MFNYYGLKLNHNKSLCPFHNDNNPSLVVHPKKNIATCFSCGVTGNVISFVQKYEKQVNGNDLSINQAIAKVVEICNLNIDISKLNRNSNNNQFIVSSRKYTAEEKHLIEVNEYLSKLFHYNLTVINKDAKNYLHNRKVEDKQINELNLGFAVKGQLLKLTEKNDRITREDLIKLKYLRIDENGNTQEVFSNRIMFPICDEKGNILSFAGRGIKDEQPKYLHTAENSLFQKKELLYNYSNAKSLSYNNELILSEGFLDVAGAKRLGFENVSSLMGLVLTEEHLRLIKKNNSTITLALDNDRAGHDAMIKLIPELIKRGLKVNVLDFSKIGKYKDFGDLSEADVSFMDIQNCKVSGFDFLLSHKYFKDLELKAQNISFVYKELKKEKIIINTYDDALFRDYIMENTDYTRQDLEEIMYPKAIKKKESIMDNFTTKAMTNYLYTEVLIKVNSMNDKVLSFYFNNHKTEIEERLVSIFNMNPDKYLKNESSNLNRDELLTDFLKDNKDYSDYESLNRFKYLNVFDKTYIKNSNGSARIRLDDNQIQTVIKQYENSLSDQDKLALEEVEELYIINNLDDIDGILSYKNKTLDILKENIKEKLFLNKGKMEFFKFGSLFLNVDKDFIDTRFKGKTGNFKTILFYNNLDNSLVLNKNNVITKESNVIEERFVSTKELEQDKKEDYIFSINQLLLVSSLETETHYFVRIPNTDAKEYFYVPKNECEWTENGELFYTKLRDGEYYKIYDRNGEYLYEKSFKELKTKWEDKTKKQKTPSNEKIKDSNENSKEELIFDNSYISKYKEPISRIYKSKIYLETEKGFYIKTNDSSSLLFAIKKICSWTDDKSYLIICPRKGLFNSGLSKYSLEGFKKTFEKRINYNEISKYLKIFYPNESKKKDVISINVPKYKCKLNSNFVEVPLIINNISGYIDVNIIKTKINKESVIIEFTPNEQIGFHDKEGNYVGHYSSNQILEYYNQTLENDKIINFPSEDNEIQDMSMLEKEVA